MRLINTSTLLFEEFLGRNIPKYAILSHTWEEEEVSFKDMSDSAHKDKKGYQKIHWTCKIARQDGISYAWIDTCCIDKSSSAELTEAINSMYQWYERAEICYAYLSDLPTSAPLDTALKKCRWFTRGWTLQELIAPKQIYFFDCDWSYVDSKEELSGSLERITGIDEVVLLHSMPLKPVIVAQKMSWAGRRETTRIEDMAYCLLGIFNVNMPLLYGEEDKAFRRLQEEIIKSTADLSIFAWVMPEPTNPTHDRVDCLYSGVLAESPAAFGHSLCSYYKYMFELPASEFSISNLGIKSQIPIHIGPVPGKERKRYLWLLDLPSARNIVAIILRKVNNNQFIREDPYTLILVSNLENLEIDTTPKERYFLSDLPTTTFLSGKMKFIAAHTRQQVIQISLPPNMAVRFEGVEPKSLYDAQDQLFLPPSRLEWSPCIISLSLRFGPGIDYQLSSYVVRRSTNIVQCSLAHDEVFRSEINEIRRQISTQTCSEVWMLKYLTSNKVPKMSSLAIKGPGEYTALISVKSTLNIDFNICKGRFWRITFSCEYIQTDLLPPVQQETW